jgi:hypothetical protein
VDDADGGLVPERIVMFTRGRWAVLIVGLSFCRPTVAGDLHVSPDGTPRGDGSRQSPWDLATALAATDQVGAGDTVWLHAGNYRGGFESRLSGTADAPVTIRQAPGERATIDCRPRDAQDNGLFAVTGDHAIYWGFEITCSDFKRRTQIGGSWPADIRRGGVHCRASDVKFIHLVVHDTAGGFGFWSEGEGGEIYGSLIFHNGWQGPDRGHGHAIYAQNKSGTKRLRENILFRQFGEGIHCYGSEKAFVQGFDIEGNVGFHNGTLAGPRGLTPSIFIGGGASIERLSVVDNLTYDGPLRCGYPWGALNRDAVVRGNYVVGGILVRDFDRVEFTGNTVVCTSGLVSLESSGKLDLARYAWDDNHYFRTTDEWSAFEVAEGDKRAGLEFEAWQAKTGFDATSIHQRRPPEEGRVFVRPSHYEPGRGHVVVYNWQHRPEVEIDLSGVVPRGKAFKIVSAQHFYGEPVMSGVYEGGAVKLPMRPRPGLAPVGMPDFVAPTTEPEFGAYVVLTAR